MTSLHFKKREGGGDSIYQTKFERNKRILSINISYTFLLNILQKKGLNFLRHNYLTFNRPPASSGNNKVAPIYK